MARRFTEAEKQAALADLKNGMTLEQASKKHKCSAASLMQWKKRLGSIAKAAGKGTRKAIASPRVSSAHSKRVMELEDESRQLRDENRTLRSLMLNGYIAGEQHPKLKQIAQTLRDAGSNQLQRIMEIILVEVEETGYSESLNQPELEAGNEASNGLPRHPSGTLRLRRKAEQAI